MYKRMTRKTSRYNIEPMGFIVSSWMVINLCLLFTIMAIATFYFFDTSTFNGTSNSIISTLFFWILFKVLLNNFFSHSLTFWGLDIMLSDGLAYYALLILSCTFFTPRLPAILSRFVLMKLRKWFNLFASRATSGYDLFSHSFTPIKVMVRAVCGLRPTDGSFYYSKIIAIIIIFFVFPSNIFGQQKVLKNINNFSGGELSPLVGAREDLSKFHSGLTTMENMIPLPQGAAQKRPGTVYVAESKNNTKVRVLPFEYSTEQAYIIELGNQYFRFFTNNAQILDGVGTEDISSLDNIIAHWLLNETEGTSVVDDDGATHNGTAAVDASALTVTGKVGTGAFDLDDQYTVEVADHADFSFTDDADDSAFSIACWAYVTEQAGLQTLLSKWRDSATTQEWRLSLDSDRKLQLHLVDSSVNLESSRIAQWKLNESAADKIVLDTDATSHDGLTQVSNTSVLSATGKISTCLDFGGADAVVITNDHAELSFGDGTNDSAFSIAAWVYVTDHTAAQIILSKTDDFGREWAIWISSTEKPTFELADESANALPRRTADDALTVGWHLVIGTYDGAGGATAANTIKFYVDDSLVASTASNDAAYVAMEDLTEKVVIGARKPTSGLELYFQDKIDNVILFNKELSSAEAAVLWNDGDGVEDLATTNGTVMAVTDDALTTGWHFLGSTYSAPADETTAADGIILYVDGAAAASTNTNSAAYTAMQGGAEEIRIGSQRNSGDSANENFFDDKIDEVSVFGDVLTPTEVASLYSTTPYEITTPYLTADLFEIKHEQSADVLYLNHPDYEPRKLSRLANNIWTLTALDAQGGPFQDENTDETYFITPSAITGSITLTASGTGNNPFYTGTSAGHEPSGSASTSKSQTGALFKLVQPLETGAYEEILSNNYTADQTEDVSWMDCGSIAKGVTWYLTTLGTWTGTLEVQRNYTIGAAHGAAGWETVFTYQSTDDRNASTNAEETVAEADYRVILTASGDAAEPLQVYFRISDTEHIGIVEITSVSSPTSATGTVIKTLADTTATHRWSEGAWSNYRGWPRTVTFFEDRLVFGGNANQPDTIWASVTADYENFTEGADDDDALNFTLSSRQVNVIEWLIGKDKLLIGTSGAEWTLAGGTDEPLTPSNVKAEQHSNYGSANLQALLANESVLFFQRGAEKMRELAYNWELDSFVAPDMTILAEHITGDGITEMDYQKTPNTIIYCVREDGQMPVFVYERKELITSWSRYITDGSFESVAVISGDPEDQVWVSAKRTINSSDVRYIEYFKDRDFGSDVDDAFFVDSGITYDSTATTTITGLGHLEAETVAVLGDGAVQTSQTVSSGQITIDSASTVQAGLVYDAVMKTMPMSLAAQGASVLGRMQRINQVYLNYYNSGDFYIGRDSTDKELLSVSGMDTSDTDTTDNDRITFPVGYDRFGQIYIYQQSPEPFTLIGMLVEVGFN